MVSESAHSERTQSAALLSGPGIESTFDVVPELLCVVGRRVTVGPVAGLLLGTVSLLLLGHCVADHLVEELLGSLIDLTSDARH